MFWCRLSRRTDHHENNAGAARANNVRDVFRKKKNDHKKISGHWQQLFLYARTHRCLATMACDVAMCLLYTGTRTSPMTSAMTPKPTSGYESNNGLVNGFGMYSTDVKLTGDLMRPKRSITTVRVDEDRIDPRSYNMSSTSSLVWYAQLTSGPQQQHSDLGSSA